MIIHRKFQQHDLFFLISFSLLVLLFSSGIRRPVLPFSPSCLVDLEDRQTQIWPIQVIVGEEELTCLFDRFEMGFAESIL